MTRSRPLDVILIVIAIIVLVVIFTGCSRTTPDEGCVGHGGVTVLGHDATNNDIPFACKDGTIGKLHM